PAAALLWPHCSALWTPALPEGPSWRATRHPRGYSLPFDTQPMRLQHPLDVLPTCLVTDPRPYTGLIQDDVDGSGSERTAKVLVKAALIARDDQLAPQLAQ